MALEFDATRISPGFCVEVETTLLTSERAELRDVDVGRLELLVEGVGASAVRPFDDCPLTLSMFLEDDHDGEGKDCQTRPTTLTVGLL